LDELNRSEVLTLKILNNLGCRNRYKALTIRKISLRANLSYYTIRLVMRGLVMAGLCGNGIREFNAGTYYITAAGREELKNIKNT
jgi:predicted transcriptional regulator